MLGIAEGEINQQLRQAGWEEGLIRSAWAQVKSGAAGSEVAAGINFPEDLVGRGKLAWLWQGYRKYAVITAAAIILLGGGYFAYAQYASSPERIWQTATRKTAELKTRHLSVQGSYTDQPSAESQASGGFAEFLQGTGGFTVTLDTEGDFRTVPGAQPDFNLSSTAGFKVGGFNISVELESRKLGQNLYYKVGNNLLAAFFGPQEDETQKPEWLQIDLGKKPAAGQADNFFQELFQKLGETQIKEIQEAFNQVKLIKPGKLLGTEALDGQKTYRYQATLDKEALRQSLERITAILAESETEKLPDLKPLLDKLEMKKIEVWIGKADRHIQQIVIETSFPSALNGFSKFEEIRQARIRDETRVLDIGRIDRAIRLFQESNKRYPLAKNGLPDLTDGSPPLSSYLSSLPFAPTPPDGSCSREQNFYWYEQLENGTGYKLRYCLGQNTDVELAGINEISAQGPVVNQEGSAVEQTNPWLNIPFSATLNLQIKVSKFNEPVTIEAPQGALDYLERQQNRQYSERELSMIGQIQAALELYHNQNQIYPEKLEELQKETPDHPALLTPIPQPLNTTGECAGIGPFYNYQPSNDRKDYTLEFCLLDDYQGLERGIHRASPLSGIQ